MYERYSLRKRHVQEFFRMLALDVCGFLGTDSVSAQNGVRALMYDFLMNERSEYHIYTFEKAVEQSFSGARRRTENMSTRVKHVTASRAMREGRVRDVRCCAKYYRRGGKKF